MTALVLLAWTATDLTATQLCPADGMAPVAVADLNLTPTTFPDPVPANPAQSSHVDDCFCCSHCVNIAAFDTAMFIGAIRACESVASVRILFADGHPLYHPPQPSKA